ncbi:MAG: hypothetical protein ACYST5_15850 [Planctomycetota bacterium]
MKGDRRKILKRIVIAVAIAVFVGPALCILYHFLLPLYLGGFMFFAVKEAEQRQVRLLCETDHQALLEACRELSRRVATGDLKPQQYNVRIHLHPAASRFPQPILDLEPTYVIINRDGCVHIELHGGFLHYGAMAYPKDYKKPPIAGFKLGDKKLIDGLWYYSEGYEGNPKQQKRIEALLQKGK